MELSIRLKESGGLPGGGRPEEKGVFAGRQAVGWVKGACGIPLNVALYFRISVYGTLQEKRIERIWQKISKNGRDRWRPSGKCCIISKNTGCW